jgi:hypothetical protein
LAPGDIFIHTWDTASQTDSSYWNNYLGIERSLAERRADIDGIIKAYSPKQILVEPSRSNLKIPGFTGERSHDFGCKVMYESRRKAFEMADSSGQYDRIFSTRLDIEYLAPLPPGELLSKNVVTARHGGLIRAGSHTDLWYHSTHKDMDALTMYYFYIDHFWFTNPNKKPFHELNWTDYTTSKKLVIEPSAIKFRIPRVSGEDTYFPE